MPDISMCDNSRCSLSSTCYRYKATPTEYLQSYLVDVEPVKSKNGKYTCEHYIKCKPCKKCNQVDYHLPKCPNLRHN